MPFPENFIERFGIACEIKTIISGSYDANYGELDYSAVSFTTQTVKMYVLPDENPEVTIYEAGWSDLPNLNAWMKRSVTLTTGGGPEHDIIKVTESGHKWQNQEFDVMRVYKHPLAGHYQLLLEPRRGTDVTT